MPNNLINQKESTMTESKHLVKSKIFIGALVGILSNALMIYLRSKDVDFVIDEEMQIFATTAILGLIAGWRTQPVKNLHVKSLQKVAEVKNG